MGLILLVGMMLPGKRLSGVSAVRGTHSILRFGGECSLLEIEKGKAAARQRDARIIIGAGGGKVLDTARACPRVYFKLRRNGRPPW